MGNLPKITLKELKELYYDTDKYSYILGHILINGEPEPNNCITVVNKHSGIDTMFQIIKEDEN